MSKPWIHAKSSARRFGGQPEDYLEIHTLMDSSKGAIADSRHRALTHTSWFLSNILERIFGVTFKNSDGTVISTRDIGEQHILEDFGGRFIPTPQDYFEHCEFQQWMIDGKRGCPSSYKKLATRRSKHVDSNGTVPESQGSTGSRKGDDAADGEGCVCGTVKTAL